MIYGCHYFRLRAQNDDSSSSVLDARYPQEKLYLHFDKQYYNPGETIWFKAYMFAANVPSQISKTVYAELIDENGKIIERKTAPVVMSSASAAFDLPEKLTSSTCIHQGIYRLDAEFRHLFSFIQKAIPIVQPRKQQRQPRIVPKNSFNFFPKVVNWFREFPRVAFKATDLHGLPYKVKGDIVGQKGKIRHGIFFHA